MLDYTFSSPVSNLLHLVSSIRFLINLFFSQFIILPTIGFLQLYFIFNMLQLVQIWLFSSLCACRNLLKFVLFTFSSFWIKFNSNIPLIIFFGISYSFLLVVDLLNSQNCSNNVEENSKRIRKTHYLLVPILSGLRKN